LDEKLTRTIASTATIKLASLPGSDLLYTPLEERFERLTRLGRRTLNAPVAAVILKTQDKQWVKSVAGWNVTELPETLKLCDWTAAERKIYVIRDMATDPRTAGHPFVIGSPKLRFYAGYPLYDADGMPAGVFCVFDTKPRELSQADEQVCVDLAQLTQQELLSDQVTKVRAALTAKLSIARREAMMDPLTRLWNRRGANMLLKAALDRADRENHPLGVAVLDLDNFKRINDTYGHQAGDELLRKIGARLVSAVRGQDLTFRLGGDEFLLLMIDTDEDIAKRIAERVRRAITDDTIRTRSGSLPASVSVGLTMRAPHEQLTVDQLLERADQALRRSKADGRNRVRIAG
jgi:diguanylate cyclase (GGDEF)-like protein